MTSQGWQPGDYLGAENAAHAEFHTAANASHIRVSIKDDNLGLGAKVGSGVGHGECTGLDAFKNLLGRLNGKDEDELAKEQKSREDLKRAIYTERRWGSIRFVPGGFLIGDKIQPLIDAEAERIRKLADGSEEASGSDSSDSSSSSEDEDPTPAPVEKSKKSKKRKIEDLVTLPEVVAVKTKKSKMKRKSEASPEDEEEITTALKEVKLSKKKSKKERSSKPDTEDTQDEERSKRKKEKKDRKNKKEQREKKKDKSKSSTDEDSAKESKKKSKRYKHKSILEEVLDASESSRAATKESRPLEAAESSGRSTPMMQGRHAVRSRNIAQKRLANMDVASLNQVSMPLSLQFSNSDN